MKRFLTPFTMLVAAFAADNASATQVENSPLSNEISISANSVENERLSVHENGNEFTFVLKRNAENGKLMAWHESHASHASHSSHSSHSSHYSSRW